MIHYTLFKELLVLEELRDIVSSTGLPADLPRLAVKRGQDGDIAVVGGGTGLYPAVARVN